MTIIKKEELPHVGKLQKASLAAGEQLGTKYKVKKAKKRMPEQPVVESKVEVSKKEISAISKGAMNAVSSIKKSSEPAIKLKSNIRKRQLAKQFDSYATKIPRVKSVQDVTKAGNESLKRTASHGEMKHYKKQTEITKNPLYGLENKPKDLKEKSKEIKLERTGEQLTKTTSQQDLKKKAQEATLPRTVSSPANLLHHSTLFSHSKDLKAPEPPVIQKNDIAPMPTVKKEEVVAPEPRVKKETVLLSGIKSAFKSAVEEYAKWYADFKSGSKEAKNYRGEAGVFTSLRHTKKGQDRASNLNTKMQGMQTEDDALHEINRIMQSSEGGNHVHSFKSFLLDKLKAIQNVDTPWKSLHSYTESKGTKIQAALNHGRYNMQEVKESYDKFMHNKLIVEQRRKGKIGLHDPNWVPPKLNPNP